jgi:hypothetical protein
MYLRHDSNALQAHFGCEPFHFPLRFDFVLNYQWLDIGLGMEYGPHRTSYLLLELCGHAHGSLLCFIRMRPCPLPPFWL